MGKIDGYEYHPPKDRENGETVDPRWEIGMDPREEQDQGDTEKYQPEEMVEKDVKRSGIEAFRPFRNKPAVFAIFASDRDRIKGLGQFVKHPADVSGGIVFDDCPAKFVNPAKIRIPLVRPHFLDVSDIIIGIRFIPGRKRVPFLVNHRHNVLILRRGVFIVSIL